MLCFQAHISLAPMASSTDNSAEKRPEQVLCTYLMQKTTPSTQRLAPLFYGYLEKCLLTSDLTANAGLLKLFNTVKHYKATSMSLLQLFNLEKRFLPHNDRQRVFYRNLIQKNDSLHNTICYGLQNHLTQKNVTTSIDILQQRLSTSGEFLHLFKRKFWAGRRRRLKLSPQIYKLKLLKYYTHIIYDGN